MQFHHGLKPIDLSEQIASLINTYNDLSFRRTAIDVMNGKVDYVVESHGRWVLGCCGIERLNYQITEIKHLAVHADWRRKGVGRFLVKRALEMCETPLTYATIRAGNEASLALFGSLGFRESATYPTDSHQVALLVRVGPKWKEAKPSWTSVSSDEAK